MQNTLNHSNKKAFGTTMLFGLLLFVFIPAPIVLAGACGTYYDSIYGTGSMYAEYWAWGGCAIQAPSAASNTSGTNASSNSNTSGSNTSGGTNTGSSGTSGGYYTYHTVHTGVASNITDSTARLNAEVDTKGNTGSDMYGWFEWGNSPSLGNKTPCVYMGKGKTLYMTQNISGLTPGTAYFFKPVVQNGGGMQSEGSVYVFQTTGVSPIPPASNTSASSGSGSSSVSGTGNTGSSQSGSGASSSSSGGGSVTPVKKAAVKTPSKSASSAVAPATKKTVVSKKTAAVYTETLTITTPDDSDIFAAPEEVVSKSFSVENTTGKKVRNVKVIVALPESMSASFEGNEDCERLGQVLTFTIGDMEPGQKNTIEYSAKITGDVTDKSALDTLIFATGDKVDGKKIESVEKYTMIVDTEKKISDPNIAAAALAKKPGGGIFPKTITDWSVIIVILAMIAGFYFFRPFFGEKEENYGDDLSSLLGPASVPPLASIPQKPVVSGRKYVRDPFYKNSEYGQANNGGFENNPSFSPVMASKPRTAPDGVPPENLPV